jgi:hypothetical protein
VLSSILIPLGIYFTPPSLLAFLSARSTRRSLSPSIVFVTSIVLQQLLFALYAAIFANYAVALPLAFVSLLLLAIVVGRSLEHDTVPENGTSRWQETLPWVLFVLAFALYTSVRTRYPFLHFDNSPDDVGVEKLFNLSLQQSFLYGESFPPEWVWLGGEQIRYYSFLKSIPGLWFWLARVVCNDPATGGIFFIISEAFFIALIPMVVSGWILHFGRPYAQARLQRFGVMALAVFTGLFLLVGAHARALLMGWEALLGRSSGVDWWALTRHLPGTDNQYIGWLLMLGDNHAYSQVYFVQLLFWGFFTTLLLTDRCAIWLSIVVGMIAAAVVSSHPASALIDISSLGLAALMIAVVALVRGNWKFFRARISNAGIVAVTALLALAPIYEPVGSLKFVFPETRLLSHAWEFAQLNLSVLTFLGVVVISFVPFRAYVSRLNRRTLKLEWLWVAVIIVATTAYLMDRPALSLMVLLSVFVYAYFSSEEDPLDPQSLVSTVAACSFWIWLIPEILAFDHTIDNRTDWIRFQVSLRLWPEAFLLIPFSIALAALPGVRIKRGFVTFSVLGAVLLVIFGISHKPGIENRIARANQQRSLDGFQALSTMFPADEQIVAFLRALPESPKVVIAEACGVGRPNVPWTTTGRVESLRSPEGSGCVAGRVTR